ncbi:hypothetical protein P7H71_04600 [Lactococcus lactis]|jgi:hypothetical protein|uniref:Transglutaminase-like domain-containing protein n=2 Tax=Streptococcaceae TaxID=1300 RepID=A0AAP5PAP0_9LACT|nr:hypothetical protein [Lactococcus lactis]MDT2859185.1 hypothetical protein [Lactococcus lactis]MDT2861403.1 hypothetical protein [Lactococcus lactis]MDT2867387.1 hypothetical protein [Lactococcus lactis]MDT2872125.1 hypothetical protein [Lactococcus lactis]MDT2876592.1 hypothetical protein [Lactococcus lactis]
MENMKKNYLKEMFEYRKKLKEYPNFRTQFNFEDNIDYFSYASDSDRKINFQEYDIPTQNNLSTLEYVDQLFSWIDAHLKHDGYTPYRGKLYGKDILKYAIDEGGGINCLMHGIILQEIFVNSGFKAFLVQCNPYDYRIGDCHWLISLYVEEYNKWMMVDPVWLGFCTNIEGIPLDFFEIRNAIIENKKFYTNKKIKVDYYEYLMCRYLFFFGFFKGNSIGTFELRNQQKLYIGPLNFDTKLFVESKEKARFLPFNIKEYLYFSRFEEKSIHLFNGGKEHG